MSPQDTVARIRIMNKAQVFLLRVLMAALLASVALLVIYNLSPNYVSESGLLVEAFWALGLASFGLVGSVIGFMVLLIWLKVSSKKRSP